MTNFNLKRGDKVRHRQDGWLATVTEVRVNSVIVEADEESRHSGEYSYLAFEKVNEDG